MEDHLLAVERVGPRVLTWRDPVRGVRFVVRVAEFQSRPENRGVSPTSLAGFALAQFRRYHDQGARVCVLFYNPDVFQAAGKSCAVSQRARWRSVLRFSQRARPLDEGSATVCFAYFDKDADGRPLLAKDEACGDFRFQIINFC